MAKRTKTVFESQMVGHEWAHNEERGRIGRNAQGNYHFKGEIIYSYAQPIARRIPDHKGQNPIFLIRDYHYSITTSRHQSGAERSVFGTRVLRHVLDIGAERFSGDGGKIDHKKNLKNYAQRIQTATITLGRARAGNKEWRLRSLQGEISNANKYAEVFKLKTRWELPTDETIAAVVAVAKAAAKAASAAERKANDERAARNAAVEAQRRADILAALPKWLAGESVQVHLHGLRDATGRQTDYIRIEGEEVVTTRGARVPLHHARRAIAIIKRVMDAGTVWEPTDKTLHLGPFAVNYINGETGFMTVGCHSFDREEIDRAAKLLAE